MSTELTVTTQQQAAWIGLAARKNTTIAELERRELALQSLLLQPGVDKAATLKTYRAEYTALQNYRKDFTAMIDNALVQPLMLFEKRSDPKNNEQYRALEAAELADRLELERKRMQTMAVEQERTQFKAHILNEYERTVGELRIRMYNEIKAALKENCDKKAIIETLEEMQALPLQKFVAEYLTIDDKTAIYNSIPKPDYGLLVLEMVGEMERIASAEQIDVVIAEVAQETDDNIRINGMVARAAIVEVAKPKVKRNVEVVHENTIAWATRIMGYFVSYDLYTYIRVKDVSKLTIAQMAKAIGEYSTDNGEELEGLDYTEIVK
jgi:hypothetical protein